LDLVILTADKNTKLGLQGLLTRPARLGIRDIESTIFVHPKRDPGVLRQCHEFLREILRQAEFALVIFDREGCGSEEPRTALEATVEKKLAQNGWEARSAAVVIEPELEAWVWGEYAQVGDMLGWQQHGEGLRQWLIQEGFLQPPLLKPGRPKEALDRALRILKRPRSSSIYRDLATGVSFNGCTDPAFQKLKQTLQNWFPPRTET
jgi:hypothetical protein